MEIIEKFKIRSIPSLLKDLVEQPQKPFVNFVLTGGCQISGQLVKIEKSGQDEFAILGDSSPSGFKASFVLLNQIIALTVANPSDFASVLSEGQITRNPNEEAPGKLEVQRFQAKLAENLKAQFNISFESALDAGSLQDADLANYFDSLKALETAIKTIGNDQMGLEALRSIKTLKVKAASELGATKESQGVLISLNLTKVLPANYEKVLKHKIEAIL